MTKIISVNISPKRGTPKSPIGRGQFRVNHGLVGDAHAGSGIKQVSLLAKESYDRFQKPHQPKFKLKTGVFGENLTTEGIALHKLKPGTRLEINNVILEVTKIGKECHTPCFIGKTLGDCIMPKEGIFAIVLKDGEIKTGDRIKVKK